MNSATAPEQVDRLTVADYLNTPDGPPWFQLVEGRLLSEPSPTADHQTIVRELILAIGTHLQRFPLGTLFCGPLDVYLDDTNVFQPDLMVIMNGRREIITKQGIRGAPDFVIEVLSASNHRLDRGSKRRRYAAAGVRELWLVDPVAQSVETVLFAHRSELPAQIWHRDDSLASALFPGLSIPVNQLFA